MSPPGLFDNLHYVRPSHWFPFSPQPLYLYRAKKVNRPHGAVAVESSRSSSTRARSFIRTARSADEGGDLAWRSMREPSRVKGQVKDTTSDARRASPSAGRLCRGIQLADAQGSTRGTVGNGHSAFLWVRVDYLTEGRGHAIGGRPLGRTADPPSRTTFPGTSGGWGRYECCFLSRNWPVPMLARS